MCRIIRGVVGVFRVSQLLDLFRLQLNVDLLQLLDGLLRVVRDMCIRITRVTEITTGITFSTIIIRLFRFIEFIGIKSSQNEMFRLPTFVQISDLVLCHKALSHLRWPTMGEA
jgi:hypothetical protein